MERVQQTINKIIWIQEKDLKWYFDQKVTLPFLLCFESMYYKYQSCLIVSHDFDEKSDFFNYELSKRLPAITQFKNDLVHMRELGRGRMRRHVIKQRNNLTA